MVKTSISKHAKTVRDKIKLAIDDIFGKNLTLRYFTRTLDEYGQVSTSSTSDVAFKGDLQHGPDLDQRYLQTGVVEVGEGVLYVHPTELSTIPSPQDQVIDGTAVWEIVDQLDADELGGTVVCYEFRVKRRINTGD